MLLSGSSNSCEYRSFRRPSGGRVLMSRRDDSSWLGLRNMMGKGHSVCHTIPSITHGGGKACRSILRPSRICVGVGRAIRSGRWILRSLRRIRSSTAPGTAARAGCGTSTATATATTASAPALAAMRRSSASAGHSDHVFGRYEARRS